MSGLSLQELDAQFSELLPEREALALVGGHFNLHPKYDPCHPHHHHHHHHHHCEPPKQQPCDPPKDHHHPCEPPKQPCDPPENHHPCDPPENDHPCDSQYSDYKQHPLDKGRYDWN